MKVWIPAGLVWPDVRGWLTIDVDGLMGATSQEGK